MFGSNGKFCIWRVIFKVYSFFVDDNLFLECVDGECGEDSYEEDNQDDGYDASYHGTVGFLSFEAIKSGVWEVIPIKDEAFGIFHTKPCNIS